MNVGQAVQLTGLAAGEIGIIITLRPLMRKLDGEPIWSFRIGLLQATRTRFDFEYYDTYWSPVSVLLSYYPNVVSEVHPGQLNGIAMPHVAFVL